MIIKPDCRYFNGEKPCKFKRPCEGCDEYSPMGKRILIVKLAAMGDVLRTTPLLAALKTRYPQSHITWVVDPASYDLLRDNRHIDRLFEFREETRLQLAVEEFDLLLSLDKDARAAAWAMQINAGEKKGFGLSRYGNIFPLNPECQHAFELGLDDELKFRKNRKTYQEIIFEAVGLEYHGEPYELTVRPEESEYAAQVLRTTGVRNGSRLVGVCPGAGPLFANKSWTVEGYATLIDSLNGMDGVQVLLLGGKAEVEKNAAIKQRLRSPVLDAGNHHTLPQFSAIIRNCDLVITGDTLPMHLAIGHGKHVLAIFGPTCPQEIDLYGRGEIIVSPIECAPCYKKTCDIIQHCMVRIPAGLVCEKTRHIVQNRL
ncbi:MAG: glycosyltransferase family 9 protein [Nitrospinales bacterium]